MTAAPSPDETLRRLLKAGESGRVIEDGCEKIDERGW
jgi:hypothetical protein